MFPYLEIPIRNVSEGLTQTLTKTLKHNPSLTRFEVARFGAEFVHLRKNTGIYHNPKRQRRISGNPA
jgi:hypothetical protein